MGIVWRGNSLGPSRWLGPPGPWEGVCTQPEAGSWPGADSALPAPDPTGPVLGAQHPLLPELTAGAPLWRPPCRVCSPSLSGHTRQPEAGTALPTAQPEPSPAQGSGDLSRHRADVVGAALQASAGCWAGHWGLSRCVSGPLGSQEYGHCPGHGRRPGGVTAADPCGSCPPWELRAQRGSWRGSHSPDFPRVRPLSFHPASLLAGCLPSACPCVCFTGSQRAGTWPHLSPRCVCPQAPLGPQLAPSPAQSPPAPAQSLSSKPPQAEGTPGGGSGAPQARPEGPSSRLPDCPPPPAPAPPGGPGSPSGCTG